ncbi:MAG: chromate transporter [Methylocella sp.]
MDRNAPPSLGGIGWVFTRYANFTLGGGSATTAVLHHHLVEKRHWLREDRFLLCFALGRLTPGTNVLAFCTGVGWLLRGTAGAITALFAASIPCAIIVTVLTALFSYWQNNPFTQSAIRGAIAAAVAITVKTCWTIAKPHFKGQARHRVILVGAAAFLLYVWAAIPPIEVLLLAGAVGALLPASSRV